jgi:predicted AlkP superfamily phosphohydrolase/phosphomutase
MKAFAIPSFYDGRVRVNLIGRESAGQVAAHDYERVVEEIVGLVSECVDPLSGERIVDFIEYTERKDVLTLGATEADIVFVWRGSPTGIEHPKLGRIGPVPYRRTGGHTGKQGFAYLQSERCPAGDYGTRSSFDVAPTLIDMLTGSKSTTRPLSGTSMVR